MGIWTNDLYSTASISTPGMKDSGLWGTIQDGLMGGAWGLCDLFIEICFTGFSNVHPDSIWGSPQSGSRTWPYGKKSQHFVHKVTVDGWRAWTVPKVLTLLIYLYLFIKYSFVNRESWRAFPNVGQAAEVFSFPMAISRFLLPQHRVEQNDVANMATTSDLIRRGFMVWNPNGGKSATASLNLCWFNVANWNITILENGKPS